MGFFQHVSLGNNRTHRSFHGSELVAAFTEILPITLKKGADEQHRLGVDASTGWTFLRPLSEQPAGSPPQRQPPSISRIEGPSRSPSWHLSAPMIVTEQLALPASNRAREHCSTPPPAAEARPGPRVPPALVRAAAPPAATQGRLFAVPWGQGRHTGKATTAALGRSAGGASRPFLGPSGARESPPTRP